MAKGQFCQGLSVAEAGSSCINSGLHGQPRLCPFGPGLSPDSPGSLLATTPSTRRVSWARQSHSRLPSSGASQACGFPTEQQEQTRAIRQSGLRKPFQPKTLPSWLPADFWVFSCLHSPFPHDRVSIGLTWIQILPSPPVGQWASAPLQAPLPSPVKWDNSCVLS